MSFYLCDDKINHGIISTHEEVSLAGQTSDDYEEV